MKLLTKGDDYGFTKGVTFGMLDAIDNGVLRNTGMFPNMPIAPWAAEQWKAKERPQACLGIDFNHVSGPSAADPKSVPHLVDEQGNFIRSNIRIKDPRFQTEEGRREMFPYEEVYRELRAQYDRFVSLLGHKPGYVGGHSISHEHFREAMAQIAKEEGVPNAHEIFEKYGFISIRNVAGYTSLASKNKIFDPMDQLNKNPLKDFLDHGDEFLKAEYVSAGGHPGFVDAELFGLTSLSLERMRDHEMMTSPVFKKWLEDNGVELITFRDLA